MYQSTKYEQKTDIEITLPWDKITAKSWGISIAITASILFFLSLFGIGEPVKRKIPDRETLVLLNFGDGDGTGRSSGNAQEEGKAHNAKDTQSNLDDAKRSAKTKKSRDASKATIDQSNNIVAVKEEKSEKVEKSKPKGRDKENVGIKGANEDDLFAGGLGDRGFGSGSGHGIGDIDWGGGGNRKVLHKEIPKYPPGVRASSKIVLQIRVLPDGTVSKVTTKQKGDPRLEIAAVKALKQWKFNPIDSAAVMIGEVPLTFVVR